MKLSLLSFIIFILKTHSTYLYASSFESEHLNNAQKSIGALEDSVIKRDLRIKDGDFDKTLKTTTLILPFQTPEPLTLEALIDITQNGDPFSEFYLNAFRKIENERASKNRINLFIEKTLTADLCAIAEIEPIKKITNEKELMDVLIKKFLINKGYPHNHELSGDEIIEFKKFTSDKLADRLRSKLITQENVIDILSPKSFTELSKAPKIKKLDSLKQSPIFQALFSAIEEIDNEACQNNYLDSYYKRKIFHGKSGDFRVSSQSTIQCHNPNQNYSNNTANAYLGQGGLMSNYNSLCSPTEKDKETENSLMMSARQKEATLDLLSCPYAIDRDASLNNHFISLAINKSLKINHSKIEGTPFETNNFYDFEHMLNVWQDVYLKQKWTVETLKNELKATITKDLKVETELILSAKDEIEKIQKIGSARPGSHKNKKKTEFTFNNEIGLKDIVDRSNLLLSQGRFDEAQNVDPFKRHGPAYKKYFDYSSLTPHQIEYLSLCIQSCIDEKLIEIYNNGTVSEKDNGELFSGLDKCSRKSTGGVDRLYPNAQAIALEIFSKEYNYRNASLSKMKALHQDNWMSFATKFEIGLSRLNQSTNSKQENSNGLFDEETLLKAYSTDVLKKFNISFSDYPYRKPQFNKMTIKDMENLLTDPPEGANLQKPSDSLKARIAISALLGDLNYQPNNENKYLKEMRRFVKDIHFFQSEIYEEKNKKILELFTKRGSTWLPPPLYIGNSIFIVSSMKFDPITKKTQMNYRATSDEEYNKNLLSDIKQLSEKLTGKEGSTNKGLLSELEKLSQDRQHWTGAFKKIAASFEGTRKAYNIPAYLSPFITWGIAPLALTQKGEEGINNELNHISETVEFKKKLLEIETLLNNFDDTLKYKYGLGRTFMTNKSKASNKDPILEHHEALYGQESKSFKEGTLSDFYSVSKSIIDPLKGYKIPETENSNKSQKNEKKYESGQIANIRNYINELDSSTYDGELQQLNTFFANPIYDSETGSFELNFEEGLVYQALLARPLTVGFMGAASGGMRFGGSLLLNSSKGANLASKIGFGSRVSGFATNTNRLRTALGQAKFGWDTGTEVGKFMWKLPASFGGGVSAYSNFTDKDKSFGTALLDTFASEIYINSTEATIRNVGTGLTIGAGSQIIKSLLMTAKAGTSFNAFMNTRVPASVENVLSKIPIYKGALNVDEATGAIGRHIYNADLTANASITAATTFLGIDKKIISFLSTSISGNDKVKNLEKTIADLNHELLKNNSPQIREKLVAAQLELEKAYDEKRGILEKLFFSKSISIRDAQISELEHQVKDYEEILKNGNNNPLALHESTKRRSELVKLKKAREEALKDTPKSFAFWINELGPDLLFLPMPTQFYQDMNKFSQSSYERGVRSSVFGNATSVYKKEGKVILEFSEADFLNMSKEQKHLAAKHKVEEYLNTPLSLVSDKFFGFKKNPYKNNDPNYVSLALDTNKASLEVLNKIKSSFGPQVQIRKGPNEEYIFDVPKSLLEKFGDTVKTNYRKISSYTYSPPIRETGRSINGNRIFEITDETAFSKDLIEKWFLKLNSTPSRLSRQFFFPSSAFYLHPKDLKGI